jgi:hypothetical protein
MIIKIVICVDREQLSGWLGLVFKLPYLPTGRQGQDPLKKIRFSRIILLY